MLFSSTKRIPNRSGGGGGWKLKIKKTYECHLVVSPAIIPSDCGAWTIEDTLYTVVPRSKGSSDLTQQHPQGQGPSEPGTDSSQIVFNDPRQRPGLSPDPLRHNGVSCSPSGPYYTTSWGPEVQSLSFHMNLLRHCARFCTGPWLPS